MEGNEVVRRRLFRTGKLFRERGGQQVTLRPLTPAYRISAANPAEAEQLRDTEMLLAYFRKALALFFTVTLLAGEWESPRCVSDSSSAS